MGEAVDGWISLAPRLPGGRDTQALLRTVIQELAVVPGDAEMVREVRGQALKLATERGVDSKAFRASVWLLCDLRLQGWTYRVTDDRIEVHHPERDSRSSMLEKERVRAAHLHERNSYLSQAPVREFIRDMERRRLGPNGWTSIFSLMRDGRPLAKGLRKAVALPQGPERWRVLRSCINPYLQFADAESVCEFTGLRVADIWRYFSYTWTNLYRGVPGRRMWVLVRDRAAENHPVIGIAALASPVVQLTCRDKWIGWVPQEFVKRLQDKPTLAWARWLERSLEELIRSLYVKDLIADRTMSRRDIRQPTTTAIGRLVRQAHEAWDKHRRFPHASQHKAASLRDDWEAQAQTHLFRAKRAEDLAQLLEVRRRLQELGFRRASKEALHRVLERGDGRRAVEVVVRHVKAAHVGVNMLDLVICGSVAPYNALLGGKLVSLLMMSPEVVGAYEQRYAESRSIIASSMAGRPVKRQPRLVILTTTSLYGVASSQYNRLRLPAEEVGGRPGLVVEFKELGRTVGFGSFHLSRETVTEMEDFVAQSQRGRRVHSLFGEGVNPRMRKIRWALDELGFPSDLLLQHGSPRLVYGVALAKNFQDVLPGRAARPAYIIPRSRPEDRTQRIVDFWTRRWFSRRIDREEVLREVERHTLVYPIEHGARVTTPPGDDDDMPLFTWAERRGEEW
jgi:hypothetical protein